MFVLARFLSTKAREQLKGLNWERWRKRRRREEEKKEFVYVCFMRLRGPLKLTMLLLTDPVGVCVGGWVYECNKVDFPCDG